MIFIVGVGRSGTSLLQSMLNTHSKIGFIPEINFIRRYLITNKLEDIYNKKGKAGLIDFLLNDKLLKRLPIDLDKVLDAIDLNSSNFPLAIYKRILDENLKKENKDIPGDKDPRSIEFLPQINNLFPDIVIINVIRDPRDILLSKMNADWSKKRPYYFHILANKIQLRMGIRNSMLFDDQYIEVKYEELISNSEEVLRSICQRLGLEYEARMLDYYDSSLKLVSEEEMPWKKETLGPLLSENMNKWKDLLGNWQVALTEGIVDIAFDHYKYTKIDPPLNPMKRILVKIVKILSTGAMVVYLIKKNIYPK